MTDLDKLNEAPIERGWKAAGPLALKREIP
jgi:hypothetical protein